MELVFFGENGPTDYMFNFFTHPEKLNLFTMYKKIHICINPYNTFTVNRDNSSSIRINPNPKTLVLTRIPNELVRFLWNTSKSIIYNEKTLTLDKDSLFDALIVHTEIMEKILEKRNAKLRRDFIAIIKILSTPVDFPIMIDQQMVRKPTKKARSLFEESSIKPHLDQMFKKSLQI